MRKSMLANNYGQLAEDYARIEQAILFLEKNFRKQPDLKEVASSVGLSEYHFQRLFSRWAGISPKRFLQLSWRAASLVLREPPSPIRRMMLKNWQASGRDMS